MRSKLALKGERVLKPHIIKGKRGWRYKVNHEWCFFQREMSAYQFVTMKNYQEVNR